ncbi:hypothetical protein GCM10009663_16140 [Kitasatospora arboriphila]|uniref:Uncharacterized protein n=1 Tax=Kitasatospora arboriphila TaxID=258052 RepID=A0ABN1TFL5_9ACTN
MPCAVSLLGDTFALLSRSLSVLAARAAGEALRPSFRRPGLSLRDDPTSGV